MSDIQFLHACLICFEHGDNAWLLHHLKKFFIVLETHTSFSSAKVTVAPSKLYIMKTNVLQLNQNWSVCGLHMCSFLWWINNRPIERPLFSICSGSCRKLSPLLQQLMCHIISLGQTCVASNNSPCLLCSPVK